MKALSVSLVFLAGLCLGMALPLTRHLEDVDHARGAVVILCSTAGFFIGGAVALMGVGHPSTIAAKDAEE